MSSLKVSFSENTDEDKPIFKQCSVENCKKIGKYYDQKDKELLCEQHKAKSCMRLRYICKEKLCNKRALYATKDIKKNIRRCENHKISTDIKASDKIINQVYEDYKKILSIIDGSNTTYDTDYDTYGSGYDTEKDLKIKNIKKEENNSSPLKIRNNSSPIIRKREENNSSPLKIRNNSSPNIRKKQENNLYFPKNTINFKKEDIKTLKLYSPLNHVLYLKPHALIRCYQRNIDIYQIYYEIHNVDIDSKKIYEICVNEEKCYKISLLTIIILVKKESENSYVLLTAYPINEKYELDNPPVKEIGIQTDNEFYDIVEMFKSNVVSLKKKDISTITTNTTTFSSVECQYNNDIGKKVDITTNTAEKELDIKSIQTDYVFEQNYNKEISSIFFSPHYSLKNRNCEILFTLYSQSIMLRASGGFLYSNNPRVFYDIDVQKIYTECRDEILRYFLYNNSTFFDDMANSIEKLIYLKSLPWYKKI